MENFEDNVEKEYHERFHDFEETLDDALWAKIQERITPEPERRPVVFWWQTLRMGIAASLLIGLLLGGYYFSTISTNTVTQTSNIPLKKPSIGKINATKSTPKSQNMEEPKLILAQVIRKNGEPEKVKFELKNNRISTKLNRKQVFEIAKNEILLSENVKNKNQKSEKIIAIKQEELPKENGDAVLKINNVVTMVLSDNSKKITLNDKNVGSINQEEISKTAPESNKITSAISTITTNAKINSGKLVLNNDTEPQKMVNNDFKEDENQVISDKKISQEIAFLESKKVNISQNELSIRVPILTLEETEIAFEDTPKRKLVFIPPSEVFANVTPMLSYYVFSPNKGDNVLVNNFNTSSERLSFAAQLGFVYPIAKKLDLRTGFSFTAGQSKISYGLTNNNQKNVTVIDELNIEVQPTKSVIIENKNWQYAEIQSDLLYEIKKLHSLSLGIRAGVQTSALNKPLFNGRIGYRVSKPVNNRVALWLEPSISFSLSSQSSIENHFLYRTTGLGLNMGVSLLRHY